MRGTGECVSPDFLRPSRGKELWGLMSPLMTIVPQKERMFYPPSGEPGVKKGGICCSGGLEIGAGE